MGRQGIGNAPSMSGQKKKMSPASVIPIIWHMELPTVGWARGEVCEADANGPEGLENQQHLPLHHSAQTEHTANTDTKHQCSHCELLTDTRI